MHKSFQFRDLADLFAKANEEKSGDQLAGLAAQSEQERVAAKFALADVPLQQIVDNPLVPPEQDDVTRLILETHDQAGFATIKSMTVGEFREFILSDETDEAALKALHWAITPEIAAAVTKLMSNKDLVLAANKIRVVTRCRNTMGQRGVLGIRLQPNHPADDAAGILLSAFDGLLYGCGDAVIGVNPATESVESVGAILHALKRLIDVYKIPTQACCLAHISTQLKAMESGAPLDLLFQSVAGTQKANESFGITLNILREGRERVMEHHKDRGIGSSCDPVIGKQERMLRDNNAGAPNEDRAEYHKAAPAAHPITRSTDHQISHCMYFETGQGSALSADAHHGVDQLTLEARAYGVARVFEPFLVNSVVGFIGPEYLYDERQIVRAGLEDHFMGKLLGLPMGCDVCYTNHAAADQNSADNLLMLLTAAGCNYFMGVPCSDDVMLNYQSTSFHDALAVRRLFNLRPAPEFLAWLHEMGLYKEGEPARIEGGARKQLAAGLEKAMK
jgi:ethanolamine ammonia-lyase large subunit